MCHLSPHPHTSVPIQDKITRLPELAAYSVVLTTYGTMAFEAPTKDKATVRQKKQGSSATPINLVEDDDDDGAVKALPRGKKASTSTGGPLYQIKWAR